MMQIGLIGLSAGVAAALLFASVMSGTMLSIPLAYLTPLPIMIAGLGWSHWAALIAALSASAAIGVYLGGIFMVAFLTGVGLPAWWLGYLTMLARPAAQGGNGAAPAALEWYPPGRLVVWSAVLGATLVLISIATVGADAEGFNAALRKVVDEIFAHGRRGRRIKRAGDVAQSATADRSDGDRHPARHRGDGDRHQCRQFMACRQHREIFRTADAALAGRRGHDLPAYGRGRARVGRRIEFRRRPDRPLRQQSSRPPC